MDLTEAERLERTGAAARVDYYAKLARPVASPVLDLGCGNGYAVDEWRRRGHHAIGVDNSFYRMERWLRDGRDGRLLVVASAEQLPFRDESFGLVVSSGVIEHVGVTEESTPYRVAERPDKKERRRQMLIELARVARREGDMFVDFPNGRFPVDFWHGGKTASFRRHPYPDALLPSLSELRDLVRNDALETLLVPLGGRLRFNQIATTRWGLALVPLGRLFLRVLDGLLEILGSRPVEHLSPFLVVRLTRTPRDDDPL